MIKNIVFDMGGVLIDWKPEEFCKRFGVTKKEDINTLVKEIYHSKDWADYDKGIIKMEDLKRQCLNRLPICYHDVAIKLISKWYQVSFPTEGMPILLRKLKDNGYKIYLLSNAGYNQPKYFPVFKYDNNLFDAKIVSAFYQMVKPDICLFNLLVDKYHLKKGETLFIDDSQINVDGAIEFGIKAYLFENCEQIKLKLQKEGIKID